MKKKIFQFLFPLLGAGLISLLIPFKEVYQSLIKPPLSPPSILFPIVWSILYLMIGYSLVKISQLPANEGRRVKLLYKIQLALNLLWPVLFFEFHLLRLALVVFIAIIVILIWFIREIAVKRRKIAYLQIPYLLWLLFALYLNIGIVVLN